MVSRGLALYQISISASINIDPTIIKSLLRPVYEMAFTSNDSERTVQFEHARAIACNRAINQTSSSSSSSMCARAQITRKPTAASRRISRLDLPCRIRSSLSRSCESADISSVSLDFLWRHTDTGDVRAETRRLNLIQHC